jgi:N utilization substance protein A
VIAHLLVAEGFTGVEDVAFSELEDLMSIEGFDEEIAEELRRRAQDFVLAEQERMNARLEELGVTEALYDTEGLSLTTLVRLGEAGVLELDDLADLSSDELRYIVNSRMDTATVDEIASLEEAAVRQGIDGSPMPSDVADAIIMAARAHWFDDEADDAESAEPEQAAE